MSGHWRNHMYLLLANLIYAVSFTIAKDIIPYWIPPAGAIVVRVSVTCLLFLLLEKILVAGSIQPQDRIRVFWCGLFGVAINQLLFFEGLARTSPINASLIMTTSPILILLLSGLFRDEAITWVKWAGVLCGAAGASLIILYGQPWNPTKGQTWGDLLIMLNAASYAMYLVLAKPLLAKYHPLTLLSRVFLAGFLFVGPIGLWPLLKVQWHLLPTTIWIELAFVVFFTTFIAYLLNTVALRSANPSLVGIYIYLQPLLATSFALWMNRDAYPPVKIFATLLIFAGVYLVSLRNGWPLPTKAAVGKKRKP